MCLYYESVYHNIYYTKRDPTSNFQAIIFKVYFYCTNLRNLLRLLLFGNSGWENRERGTPAVTKITVNNVNKLFVTIIIFSLKIYSQNM